MLIERSPGGGVTSPRARAVDGDGGIGWRDRSDHAVAARWLAGDDEALGVLFERHEQAVRQVCAARLNDRELVDEAVQRTFLRLLVKREAFAGGERLLHYLRRTARYVAIDVLREQRHQDQSLDVPIDLPDRSAAGEIEHHTERRLSVAAVLDGLSPAERELLRARYLEDRSVAEIAAALRVSHASCHTMLTRSRQRAARTAQALRIRSLVPAGMLPRLREWTERIAPTSTQLAAAATVALVAAGLTHPAPTGDNGAGDYGSGGITVATSDLPSAPTGSTWAPLPSPAVATAAPGTAPAHTGGALGHGTSEGRLLPVDEVPVPGTETTIHQQPPAEPDHTYTVTSPVGPPIGYKSEDEPTDEPVHDALCSRLTHGPIVTCTVD